MQHGHEHVGGHDGRRRRFQLGHLLLLCVKVVLVLARLARAPGAALGLRPVPFPANHIMVLLCINNAIRQKPFQVRTLCCNQMGTIFEEMSSWTAFTWYLGMKTTFYTKYTKVNMFGFLLWCFWSLWHYTKMHTNRTVALNLNFISSLFLCAVFLYISSDMVSGVRTYICIFCNHF